MDPPGAHLDQPFLGTPTRDHPPLQASPGSHAHTRTDGFGGSKVWQWDGSGRGSLRPTLRGPAWEPQNTDPALTIWASPPKQALRPKANRDAGLGSRVDETCRTDEKTPARGRVYPNWPLLVVPGIINVNKLAGTRPFSGPGVVVSARWPRTHRSSFIVRHRSSFRR